MNVIGVSSDGKDSLEVRMNIVYNSDNYYVARANALENNVSLYYTQNGRRITLKYVDAPVPANTWHTLRVEFAGTRIRVALNGKVYIELDDDHIKDAGAVGLWTKADSVTAFDDFAFQRRGRGRGMRPRSDIRTVRGG